MADGQFTISVEQADKFEFRIRFDDGKELLMDEPEPLGSGKGPNPSRLISAAIGYCLSASLCKSIPIIPIIKFISYIISPLFLVIYCIVFYYSKMGLFCQ